MSKVNIWHEKRHQTVLIQTVNRLHKSFMPLRPYCLLQPVFLIF